MQGDRADPESAAGSERAGEAPRGFHAETHFSWIRTRLSVERTLMAWNRTCLSLIGFGFTIYQFFTKLQQASGAPLFASPEGPRNFGLAFILAGTIGTLIASVQYLRITAYLGGEEFKPNALREGLPHRSLTLVISALLLAIGTVTAIVVAVGA
jgi:putative membrane protein